MAHELDIVILAAGQGKRMASTLPKVLQPLGGRPLLAHVLITAVQVRPRRLHVVVGFGAEQVRAAFAGLEAHWVLQPELRGTGDALRRALPALGGAERVLVLYGDVPLLRAETLAAFLAETPANALGLMTGLREDPQGYGRILRDGHGQVLAIREDRDASADERRVKEVNLGIMLLPAAPLRRWLEALGEDNAQGELYLTDVVALARADGFAVLPFVLADPQEGAGVNDPAQLAVLERIYQARRVAELQARGLRVADPTRLDIRGDVQVGQDCWIEPNCLLAGQVRLGNGVRVGMGCILQDVEIGDDVEILPYTLVEGARIDTGARIGPFARIRPGTEIGAAAHVGNFVEVKASRLGAGSKANHLSYLGDSDIGSDVNIGAGTITCNYDGARKHRTVIADGVFVGSASQLVAPVRVGAGATIGAGSTITKDVPAGGLTLSRSPQKSIPHWQRPQRDKGTGEKG